MGSVTGGKLLERSGEIAVLTAALRAAGDGVGGAVLIEGAAGIGKSSLLEESVREAERFGMRVLRGRGDELVMESSFAAVRELFWERVRAIGLGTLDGAARLARPVFAAELGIGDDRDRVSAVLHGLYWLTADLADEGPLVMVVDDVQWLDAASARFLDYLIRRIDALPVLLVAALRIGEPAGRGVQAAMWAQPPIRVLRPAALSAEASGLVMRGALGPRADEGLCRSCHEATQGNPFYLRELASALAIEGGRPSVELARRVRSLGVEAIRATVLVRLVRLGAACEGLVEALAVLGSGASLRDVATLAGLERVTATAAADRLHEAELIAVGGGLAFVHPIVGEAIASQIPPARLAVMHGAAARLVAGGGATTDRVAVHLLMAEPFGDGWVVNALRTAAQDALAQGAPEAAVSYLRRALAEPPQVGDRLTVLRMLGSAEALLPAGDDFASLREALALATDPHARAEIAFELALALCGVFRNAEGRAVLTALLAEPMELDPDTLERFEAALVFVTLDDPAAASDSIERSRRLLAGAVGGESRDPRTLAILAGVAVMSGETAATAVQMAERALADDRLLLDWLDAGYVTAGFALGSAEALDLADETAQRGLAEAQRRGSSPMLLQLSLLRSDIAYRAGDLATAEDYAERALDFGRALGATDGAMVRLPAINLERDRLERAVELIESVDVLTAQAWGLMLQAERGRIRVAAGNVTGGLDDLLAAHRAAVATGQRLGVDSCWVPAATNALVALGRDVEARALAEQELAEAKTFGAPGRYGIALSMCGTLDPGPAGLERLREGVEVLGRSLARLELARALVNLGAGLRARSERTVAREPLAEGLDLATRCGGWALARRARAELVACGARPRRPVRTGPDALTPAELRVARMAAAGMTNREIAQALFLSTKTVEGQLSGAYTRLGIHSRASLSAALEPPNTRVPTG
jgi:DNA-binding CsgD family transcriptional regulator